MNPFQQNYNQLPSPVTPFANIDMSKVTEFDRQKAANNFRENLQQQLDHPAIRKDNPPAQTLIANADANKATCGEFERLETGQGNVPLMNTNARYREEMTALFIQMEKE